MIPETDQTDQEQINKVNKQNETIPNSKPSHVLLTDRDLQVLAELHDHVVLSFSQIHERFFASRSPATAMNRLKQIENQDWIERVRVPRLRIQGRDKATGVVFQLTHRGREMLTKSRPEMDVFEKCPYLNVYQLDHDLLVADIAEYFKRQFPDRRWVNGRYLNDSDTVRKIPDAVLEITANDQVVAIELELTVKSARRYKEIVANLRASRRIEKVIFVTSSTSIGRKIMSAIEGYQVQPGHRLRSDLFEFVRLSECLKAKKIGA